MLREKLSQRKLINLILDNSVIYDFNESNVRDYAFMSYYLIRIGRLDEVKKFIDGTKNKIGTGINRYLDLAFWLWIVGEYLSITKDIKEPDIEIDTLNYCIEQIKNSWDKECKHWLDNSISGVLTGNIAIAYGAISSINKYLNDCKLTQILTNIKEYMFLKQTDFSRYRGETATSDTYGDVTLVAVPFGLVKLDDLFLTNSVSEVERKLIKDDMPFLRYNQFCEDSIKINLACLLSWYYSEAGYLEYARHLLNLIEDKLYTYNEIHKTDPGKEKVRTGLLSYVLFAIAEHNINIKKRLEDKSFLKNVSILHKPAGHNDPYHSEDNERYPRHPETNDDVYLKAVTQPFNRRQKVYVEYSINGEVQPKLLMDIETSPSGRVSSESIYWKTCIGKFNSFDRVDYKFEVHFNGQIAVSPQYNFSVRQWRSLKEIDHIDRSKDEVRLYFKSIGESKKRPCLCFKRFNEDSLKLSFSIKESKKTNHIAKSGGTEIFTMNFGKLILEFDKSNIHFKICGSKNEEIIQSYAKNDIKFIDILTDENGRVYKVRLNFFLQMNEKIFGMGERFSHIEFRGLEVDNCVYDQFTDHGLKTYMPVPFFISSRGYGIYFDTSTYLKCAFGARLSDLTEVEVSLCNNKQGVDFYFLTGKPKKIIQELTNLTGKPALPPKWSFGLWISSNSWDSQDDVYQQISLAEKYKIPTSAIILEQWSDSVTLYIFNGAEYDTKPGNCYFKYKDFKFSQYGKWPNPKKMVEFLHEHGIRVLLWQCPYHRYIFDVVHRQRDEDEKTIIENKFYVKYKNGEEYRNPFFWNYQSLILDFTNPEAKKWWFDKRLYLIEEIGIDGFKTDGGECILEENLAFYNGKTEEEMKNEYSNEFVGGYYNFIQQHIKGGGVTFSRAGYTGSQKFPLHWAGDDISTFKSFREAVNAGLSSGISGISFWGWDLGGFSGEIPTDELYVRSTQMAAFCPVMQYHSESSQKQKFDRTPWNIAERTNNPYVIDVFKKYVDLRMNILPYIYEQAIASSGTGIPMMRAMFLEYPDDMNCIAMTQQYMFGANMLVAPVMEEGANYKEVYLPEGKWMDFFTGEVLNGGIHKKVEAGIEQIPVYVKENCIVPLNLSNDYQLFSDVGNNLDSYTNLCFLFFITDEVKYKFSDDLGSEIDINCKKYDSGIEIDVHSNYNKPIILILKNALQIEAVSLDKKALQRASDIKDLTDIYSVESRTLYIKVTCVSNDFSMSVKGEIL